jgi:hypothetical protein
MGQLPEEYMDYLEYLENNPREYFRRVVVERTESELAHAIYEFYHTAAEAQAIKSKIKQETTHSNLGGVTALYRNITRDCSWDCPFKDVCKAELDGSNVTYLLNIGFDKEEPK